MILPPITSVKDMERLFMSRVATEATKSMAYISGLVLYTGSLFMCRLVSHDVFRNILLTYQSYLTCPSPLGIPDQYAQNLLKYANGTYRESFIRPFREVVLKQYKKRVPFEYHISYEITDPYTDARRENSLTFDTLMTDYVQQHLTLGELSVLSTMLPEQSEVLTCVSRILPVYLYSHMSMNDHVRNTYKYINSCILRYTGEDIQIHPELRPETCKDEGYRWITDLPYQFSPDMVPHQLTELIEYTKGGYVFGHPCNTSDNNMGCGVYKKKITKEIISVFDTLE